MKTRLVAGLGALLVTFVVVAARVMARLPDASLGTVAACTRYGGVPRGFPTSPHAGMVLVRGGTFVLGTTHGYRDELPAGEVTVDAFYIDRTEVTNAQYGRFVRATGYVTRAEREGGAPVFDPATEGTEAYAWWRYERGASRMHPAGPGSSARPNDPVVQVTYADALAYATWLGRALPTEAEWEWAARAGRRDRSLDRAPRAADGSPLANFWQGAFPARDTEEDGFGGRAPVGCFPANAYGLHDLIGNVWEWTRDPYRGGHRESATARSPRPGLASAYVIKGGSYLCSSDFCARYRASARHRQEVDLSGPHLGFRTLLRIPADSR